MQITEGKGIPAKDGDKKNRHVEDNVADFVTSLLYESNQD